MFIRNLFSKSAGFVVALALLAVATGQELTRVELGGQLAESVLEYAVNRADARAGGLDTVSFKYTIPQEAWISIGFTNGNGLMTGAECVVGLPNTGEVTKYVLGSYDSSMILPMPDEQQTLIDTSLVQEDGTTVMEFTKVLNEAGELPIVIGANTFIGAYGFVNEFFYHNKRDSFDLDLEAGKVEVVETRNRILWKAHGWCAAIAWGLFSPLAIGVAVLRYWFPNGLWLKIHQYLNYTVVALTIAAFGLAVAAIKSETPAGGDPQHFSASPSPHRLIGLVMFLVVLVQTLGGQFRPHNPAKGEEKSTLRRSWEVSHRMFGLALLGTAWYQIDSGIKIYEKLFADSSTANLTTIFWSVVTTIALIIVVGFFVTRILDKNHGTGNSMDEEEEVEEGHDDHETGKGLVDEEEKNHDEHPECGTDKIQETVDDEEEGDHDNKSESGTNQETVNSLDDEEDENQVENPESGTNI